MTAAQKAFEVALAKLDKEFDAASASYDESGGRSAFDTFAKACAKRDAFINNNKAAYMRKGV
jgi:hypothetical protein